MTFEGCPGSSFETDECNQDSCPTWSNWSSWSDCSASCDGGTHFRARTCLSEEKSSCVGSATNEQQCNQQSCDAKYVYWKGQHGYTGWNFVQLKELQTVISEDDTMMAKCAAYCDAYPKSIGLGCIAFQLYIIYHPSSGEKLAERCYITFYELSSPSSPSYQNNGKWISTTVFAVAVDYYRKHQSNPDLFLPNNPPDNAVEAEGLCDETKTGFGMVNFKKYEGIEFTAWDNKNIIRESDPNNCASKCFEKAGCSAFYLDDNGCTNVIGFLESFQNNDILNSGRLSRSCPSNTFKSSFTSRSQFYCLIVVPDEAQNIIDSIVERNTGAVTPFRVWSFETHETSDGMMSSSQYVSISVPEVNPGRVSRYRPVKFSIETYVRVGENPTNKKRRSADPESESVFIGELTPEMKDKLLKQAIREANKAAKQRSIMPRTDDIIAKIQDIDEQTTSFILGGGMEFPDGFEVAATSPIEIVEFVQTTADGSISADCSSGTCECSAGFIDNGNGCEEMTEEQATSTQAPTTAGTQATAQSTTPSITQSNSDSVSDWILSLVDKMEAVFENDRPHKPRSQLLGKWQKITDKFVARYEKVASHDCNLDNTYEDDSVDFSTVKTCRVSFIVA